MAFDISKLKNSSAVYGLTQFLRNLNSNRVNLYNTEPNNFQSVTSVNRSPYDRPFIIGFIPPDINVNYVPVKVDAGVALIGKTVTIGSVSSEGAEGTKLNLRQAVANKPPQFWEEYVKMCDRLKMKPEDLTPALFSESGFLASSVCPDGNGGASAKGLNQISFSTWGSLMNKAEWDNYENLSATEQLPYIEKYFRNTKIKKWNNAEQIYGANAGGGGQNPNNTSTTVLYDKENTKNYKDNKGKPIDYYTPNKGLDNNNDGKIDMGDLKRRIDAQRSNPAYADAVKQINDARERISRHTDTDSVTSTTGPKGGEKLQEVGVMTGSMDNLGGEENDPYGRLGRRISKDDVRAQHTNKVVEDMKEQIDQISKTPSMMLYVNPRSFNRNYEQSVDVAGGWRGQIVSAWLERPMKISGSGTTAAQYAVNASGFGGLTNLNKIYSLSYENLMSLALIYQNNGWIYSGFGYDQSNVGVPVIGLNLFIYYDGHIYIGSFDSFKIGESADKPWTLEYSFEFTVRYDIPLVDDVGEAVLQGATNA